jgi:Tol biopolymer transport system component
MRSIHLDKKRILIIISLCFLLALTGCQKKVDFALVFVAAPNGDEEIFRLKSDTWKQEQLTSLSTKGRFEGVDDSSTLMSNFRLDDISKDGQIIYFEARGDSHDSVLRELINGGVISKVYIDDGGQVANFRLSPDGKKIAYIDMSSAKIKIHNLNGLEFHLIDLDPDLLGFEWSSDGRYILYTKIAPEELSYWGKTDVFITDIQDKDAVIQVTDRNMQGDCFGTGPWSPIDNRVLVHCHVPSLEINKGGNYYITEVAESGLTGKFVKLDERDDCSSPAWSQDGIKIAFICGQPGDTGYGIYTVKLDGSEWEKVVEVQTTKNGIYLDNVKWAPDGTQIIYLVDISQKGQLFIVNSDGTNNHAITDTTLTPNGDFLIYKLP